MASILRPIAQKREEKKKLKLSAFGNGAHWEQIASTSNRLNSFSIFSLVLSVSEQNEKMSKGITDVDEYEFKLGKELKAMAETELRETPSAREFGLNALRDWINANPRIIAVRLGTH